MKKVIALLTVLSLTSCVLEKTPFISDKIVGVDDLKNVQFYVSDDIILNKDDDTSKVTVTRKGVLVVKTEKVHNKVKVVKGTPCVLDSAFVVNSNGQTIYVYMMKFGDSDGMSLPFGNYGRGTFNILSKRCRSGRKVKYNDNEFTVESNSAFLMIRKVTTTSDKDNFVTVKGKRVY